MNGRVEGLAAVVVGGGQAPGQTTGNGRAVACRLAREGARVMVADRDGARAEATCEQIRLDGGDASAIEVDITDENDCRRLASVADARLGRIDILHNNVGVVADDGDPFQLSIERYDQIMDINLKGMWLTCRHILPGMRDHRCGAVVNISSIAAVLAGDGALAYCMSKAAVNQLTRILAKANAPFGIRVNAIMPGLIDTPMAVDELARRRGVPRHEVADERNRAVPLGAMGTADDIAALALFLASPEARFVTGAIVPVDGGQTL